ncbi:MAG: hypothetical protein CME06_07195 [Gemmatimonadetes bacterium]|nr:hypothetical protein [Gemmatimonadota bacterium]
MILDRYVAGRFLLVLGAVLATSLSVFVLVDLFDNIDTFIDKEATANEIVRFYWFQIPYIIQLILPISALIACFFGIGGLAAHGEIDAMRAAGLSLSRILSPVFVCGVIISAFATYLATSMIPESERTAKDIEMVEIKGRPKIDLQSRSNHTYDGLHGHKYFMRRWDGRRKRMLNVEIIRIEDQRVYEHVRAERAIWRDGMWVLEDGVARSFDGERETAFEAFERLARPDLPEQPEDFSTEKRKARELTLTELMRRIDVRMRSGEPTALEKTNLHLRFSFPLSTLVLVLFGAPLSTKRKKGGAWLSFTIYVVVGFLFVMFTRLLQTLGEHGSVQPLIAAWLPDGIFAILGVAMLGWRQRGH